MLAVAVIFVTRLAAAEFYYARSFDPAAKPVAALTDTMRAQRYFPWARKFREAPALRIRAFLHRG